MKDKQELYELLGHLGERDPEVANRLVGDFDFSRYVLRIMHVQAAPGDEPTLFVARVAQSVAGFPPHLYSTPIRRTALEDLLLRVLRGQVESLARYDRHGVARRRLDLADPGQAILPRTAVVVTDEHVEVRLYLRLPGEDGRFSVEGARALFFEDLPEVVSRALFYCNLDAAQAEAWVSLMEDVDQVRQILPTRGWVAFVGEGAAPGREEGGDRPAAGGPRPVAVADELLQQVQVPNRGMVRGLGVPAGLTVLLGDEYSGRRELLAALAHGIYNHVAGDGREWVVTVPDAVRVVGRPGRGIQHVNLAAFLTGRGAAARAHSTAAADAFAAQAASTVEALEAGARLLLFDESDSAAGFLSADSRLPAAAAPTATPLAARARQMVDELGVSLLVAGAAAVAEFVPVADTVLRIEDFVLTDVTAQAKALGIAPAVAGPAEGLGEWVEKSRWVVPASLDPSRGREDAVVRAEGLRRLEFGRQTVALGDLVQLVEADQAATIGRVLLYLRSRYLDESRPIRELLDLVDRDLGADGLECLTRDLDGRLVRPRRYEIAAALNRMPTLRISHVAE